jgi:hypothetical protein
MRKTLSKYVDKLFFKKWIIGLCEGDIEEIIRSRNFNLNIHWLLRKPYNRFFGDPFPIQSKDGNIRVLLEEYEYRKDYGNISLIEFDTKLKEVTHKTLLDTKSHLSYPFVFNEKGKTYVFPESRQAGKLSCYEFDALNESMSFVKDILNYPLLDSTILKHNGKYWIFGTISENDKDYILLVFFSDNLLGPYIPHKSNPVKRGLDGTRSAGSFIEVDGEIYRPTQNCSEDYGMSIAINRLTEINEDKITEEPYMTISVKGRRSFRFSMYKIHTLNVLGKTILVDGMCWTFLPFNQLLNFFKGIFKSLNKRDHKIT